jgi:phospholipase C
MRLITLNRWFAAAFTGVAVVAGVLGFAGTSRSQASAAAPPAPRALPDGFAGRGKITSVVVIVMENRTFDNVFGGDALPGHPSPFPHADSTVPPSIAPLATTAPFAPDAGEDNWHNEFQCLAQGGFSTAQWIAASRGNPCRSAIMYPTLPPATQPFKYLDPPLRAVYWDIATKYLTSDRFFAVTSSDSYPAHQYIVAGRSADSFGEIVGGQYGGGSGCSDLTSNKNVSVSVPALGTPAPSPAPSPYPFTRLVQRSVEGECYDVPTFADQLMKRPVTWGHYVTVDDNGVFNGFINSRRWWGMQWPLSGDTVLKVAKDGRLQNFVWVAPPCVNASDHPNTGDGGPSWVRELVNAIGTSKGWDHTAIFVVWDDWGGFYDHVVPPSPRPWDVFGPGMRTPFLLISPYVKPGTVVHSDATYGSILRFVEDLYDVPSLHTVDENSPDLFGYFDFLEKPHSFTPITATDPVPWRGACLLQPVKKLERD